MQRLSVAFGLCVGLLSVGLPAPALAQERSAVEIVGGGYSFMRDFRVDENFPAGWFVSTGYNITDWLAAVGEVAGSYKSYDFSFNSETFSTTTRLHTFLAGGRYSRRMFGVIPYGQLLAGVARETGGVTIFRPSIAEAETKFALQPGGGVTIPLTDRVGARVAADYRRIFADRPFTDQKDNDEVRIAVGVVFGFNRR